MKKGISLIVLVITIIVIIILSGAVILSLSNNNPISQANEATFKSDVKSIQDQLSLYAASQYANTKGTYDIKTMDGKISDFISGITKYDTTMEVVDSKIIYTGASEQERQWLWDVGAQSYVKDGLMLWLDGYDAPSNVSGSNYWIDRTANHNNALLSNFANINNGANGSGYDSVGKAYVIGGSNEYFTINQPLNNTAFTISMVYIPTQINTSYDILYSGTDNIDMQIFFHASTKKLTTSIENDEKSVNLTLDSTTLNKPYKIDFVFDQATKRRIVYVNNVVLGDTIDAGNYTLNDTQIVFGRVLGGGYTTHGKYNNIMVYNRALSSSEISKNYQTDKIRFGLQ